MYVYEICSWAVSGDSCPADSILVHIKLQNRLVYVVTAMHLFVLPIQKGHVPLCVVYISFGPTAACLSVRLSFCVTAPTPTTELT